MYLLIDLSEQNIIHLGLFDKDTLVEKNYEGQNRELLEAIASFFKKQKFKREKLGGIMVVVGAGGFTSTRIACVVANSFAFVLQIPLLAIQKGDNVQELIPKLLKQPKGQYISATYSGEPNIGKSKK